MRRKLIAIGNRMMKDDGIALRIAEKLRDERVCPSLEIILGETDVDFCLSQIEEGDYLIILDGMAQGRIPGSIQIWPMNEIELAKSGCYFQHDSNLLTWLKLYHGSIAGAFIGIEVDCVEFGWELSEKLNTSFIVIYENVKNCINFILGGKTHA